MSIRGRGRTVAATLTLVFVLVASVVMSSGAPSAAMAEAPPVDLPAGWVTATSTPEPFGDIAIRELLSEPSLTETRVAEAQRHSLRKSSVNPAGLTFVDEVLGYSSVQSEPAGDAAAAGGATCPAGTATFDAAIAAFDHDDDGRDEFLAVVGDGSGAMAVEARRASDGAPIWQASTCLWAGLGVVDVDGDGGEEVVIFEVLRETITPVLPPHYYRYRWEQRLRVLDAATGVKRWERSFDARLDNESPSNSFDYENIAFDLHFTSDAGGSAARDVAIGFRDRLTSTFQDNYRLVMLSGDDGSHIGSTDRAVVLRGAPQIHPVDDVNGDGKVDFVSFSESPLAFELEAFDLAEDLIWRRALDASASLIRVFNLDGPARDDVLLYTCGNWDSFYGCRQDSAWSGIDGQSGGQMWSRPMDFWAVFAAGDYVGDGGTDLRYSRALDGGALWNQDFSGRTGADIGSPLEIPAPEHWWTSSFWCLGCDIDLNADGVFEHGYGSAEGVEDPDGFHWEAELVFVDGRTQAELWRTVQNPFSWDTGFPFFLGDVNGNGMADAAFFSETFVVPEGEHYISESTFTLRTLEGSNGAEVDRVTRWQPFYQALSSVVSVQADGAGARDTLVSTGRVNYNGSDGSVVALYSAADVVWSSPRSATSLTATSQIQLSTVELTAALRAAPGGPGVSGRAVHFFVDGVAVGRAVTGSDGVATLSVSRRYRGVVSATFSGDAAYGPSAS